ncbi:MAG TPA: tetratricopeptide repeat protein [Ktedonobacteraceae bacterium]|nr:tetratricopeptide repeat protein [Ktedonobacteraceae bacterium]
MTQTTLREYLRTTEDAISSGRIEEAMTSCQNVLKYFPQALEAQRLLGEVYLAQGRLQEAQQTFEWILTNDPENVIVYCDRALISERTSDVDTALDCYQQAYELSRGNASIRQEFNQISAQAGQQEFMFSRAGLARLYMRGDLLTQAIQEWEAVLAISPERLDARLGLMETYWREGMFDKAEQVATQLLEEIPTCLKALLFLAHMTSLTNVARAQELLKRAAEMDPDLRVAQDVFSDLAARVPNDPFLELIKKDPIMLENGVPVNLATVGASAMPTRAANSIPGSGSPSHYGTWETLNIWEQQAPASPTLNTSTPALNASIPDTPTRAGNENGLAALRNGNLLEDDVPTWQGQLEQATRPNSFESEMPTWQGETSQPAPTPRKEQPWYQEDSFTAASSSPASTWESESTGEEQDQLAPPSWLSTLTQNEQHPAEPLAASNGKPTSPELRATSLNSNSQKLKAQQIPAQEDEAMPFLFPSDEDSEEETNWPEWLKSLGAESLEPEGTPSSELVEPVKQAQVMPAAPAISLPREEANFFEQPSSSSEDPWAALPMMSANNDTWSEASNQPDWMQQLSNKESAPAQNSAPDWMQQLSSNEEDISLQNTQNTSLEWLQSLPETSSQDEQKNAKPEWMQSFTETSSQGTQGSSPEWMQSFTETPSQGAQGSSPEWMQSFSMDEEETAQNSVPDWMQQFSATSPTTSGQNSTPDWMSQPKNTGNQLPHLAEQEERYLASLEDLEKSLQSQGFTPLVPGSLASIASNQPSEPIPAVPAPSQPQEQPTLSSALAQLGNLSQPAATQPVSASAPWWNSMGPAPTEQAMLPEVPHTPGEPVSPFAALSAPPAQQAMPELPLPATPLPQPSAFEPMINNSSMVETHLTPAYRSDALLDNDLETTMKRPAIKLQPMKTGELGDAHSSNGKGYGERNTDDANLSSHERLVRGYQYQLSGAYDESMQEYRLIIRNAPELLDDVISNMRALLKLNPRFSVGYRVLGDAYMRKGEYLQAMESYNKALTMAKKARH